MDNRRTEFNHLNTEQLLDYLDRRLSPADTSVVEEHLATDCQACHAEMVWLQDTLNLMVSNIWLEPPARLQTAARRMFREQQKRKTGFVLGEWLSSLWVQPRSVAMAGAAMLILVVIAGVLLWSTQTTSPVVKMTDSQGTVAVQPAGGEIWVPASEEVALESGSAVRTGNESSVILTFPDESKVLIAPNTELEILRMNAQPNGSTRVIVLRQTYGSTENVVQKTSSAASRYEVQTPSATVIVQGTIFTVEVDDARSTRVLVSEGTVAVAAQGITIALDAGQTTTVDLGEAPIFVNADPTKPSSPEPTVPAVIEDKEDIKPEVIVATETPVLATPQPSLVAPPPTISAPIQPPQPTNTPTSPQPLPTETEVPPPTALPTEKPDKTKVPPGQTRTPQPPGHTRNPSSASGNGTSK